MSALNPSRNLRLQGSFAGQRVHICGNGRSLADVNFRKIHGDSIITVGDFLLHNSWNVRPLCHVVRHPQDLNTSFFERVTHVQHYVFPLAHQTLLRRFAPSEILKNAIWLKMKGSIRDNPNADFTEALPEFENSLLIALAVAFNLGFSEIRLLGCEMEYFQTLESITPLRWRPEYFYNTRSVRTLDVDYLKYSERVLGIFEGFHFLKNRLSPEQKVFIDCPNSRLDMFPRNSKSQE